MQTITDKLQILKDNTEDIRKALSDKVGYDAGPMLKDYPKIIDDIKKDIIGESDVNFYDYDGTLLDSYTKDEFLALTSLPKKIPSHDGLICQGWNWTLGDAKEHVQEYGKLNIGVTYITDDGKTRLYINLLNGGISVPIGVNNPSAGTPPTVTIDWGDGNYETVSDHYIAVQHTYNEAGSYIISLNVDSGTCSLGFHNYSSNNTMGKYNTIPSCSLYKVEIGSNIYIGDYAFQYCYSLQSVTIPNSVYVGWYAFQYCRSLRSVTIPNLVEHVWNNTFMGCNSLQSVSLPKSLTTISDSAFYECYSLSSITIPNSVTTIGDYAFYKCNSLSSITIPNSVTTIDDYAFYECNSLQSVTMPNSLESIGDYVFCNCYSLSSITLPNSLTSIGDYVFQYCYSLSSLTIPNSVTSIGSGAFLCCYGMQYYDFTSHTSIPTLSNVNAFHYINDGCEIRVPANLYSSWKSATNWYSHSGYIVSR